MANFWAAYYAGVNWWGSPLSVIILVFNAVLVVVFFGALCLLIWKYRQSIGACISGKSLSVVYQKLQEDSASHG